MTIDHSNLATVLILLLLVDQAGKKCSGYQAFGQQLT